MNHSRLSRPMSARTAVQRARRSRKLQRRRAGRAEVLAPTGLTAFLDFVTTLGVVGWFKELVTARAPQAVFHKAGCFLALLVRAVVGIGGMGDLVVFLCKERLSGRLGFEKDLTFVNPLADLLKDFTEEMINTLLQRVVRTLVRAGVQLGEIVAVDSTFLQVFGKMYEAAARGYSGRLGKTANGYKLHVAYDVQLRLPLAIWITPGNVSDADSLVVLRRRIRDVMGKRPNQMFILDRGYFYPEHLAGLASDDAFFVCRAKLWPKYITGPVQALKESDFTFRTAKYRVASMVVTEPTQKMQLKMVVVRHVKFPKPLVLVTNNLKLRAPQVYRLYRKRFQVEALFQELRGKWHLNRFVGNRLSHVIGHIGLAVIGLTLHRCFRQSLQQHTARAGIKTLRRIVYAPTIPDVPPDLTSRQLSRAPLHRLARELVKLLYTGATRIKAVLVSLLKTSFPEPRILIESCTEP